MNIEKCIEKYSDESYKEMFGLHSEISPEESMVKAKLFLDRFAIVDKSTLKDCLFTMRKLFRPDGYKGFDVSKMHFSKIFNDDVTLFSYISSPLFWNENFFFIQNIAKIMGEKYFYIIEDEECEEHADAAFQLKIPVDISWEELSDGGFVSDVVFNMFHNNYLVFGDSGNWGRWSDYENTRVDYEVFGYKTNIPEIQNYRDWYAMDKEEMAKMNIPDEIKKHYA